MIHRLALRLPLVLLCLSSVALCAANAPSTQPVLEDSDIAIMKKACDWQLSVLPTLKAVRGDSPLSWIRAPFYVGAMALYRLTHEDQYLSAMSKLAEENHYAIGSHSKNNNHHADDYAVGQLYAELYELNKDPKIIETVRKRVDQVMAAPLPGREDWWWCDALFMAPPLYARLSAITDDRKYLDFADKQFWDTSDFLYDKDEHLYFRDKSFFKKTEKNGKKVFWSRGNGWVMGGIVRVLQYMPKDHPSRPKYIELLTKMAEKIAALQQPDGFWRASLLDPGAYPGGETSGTGFYCYAITWGINEGVLPREKYLPVVQNAWKALKTTVDPTTGKVGWVQPVGSAPAAITADNTEPYGTGALLLAGTEMVRLNASSAK